MHCRCMQDRHGKPTGFDLVSQARTLSLVPEEEKGAQVRRIERSLSRAVNVSSILLVDVESAHVTEKSVDFKLGV